MKDIIERLKEISDSSYAEFQAKLTPTVEREKFIGVRVPILRNFAKEYVKEEESKTFLSILPHEFYDENMLHGLLLSLNKDFDYTINAVDKFLPYVDNWAVCDIMSPKIFAKHKDELLVKIKEWIKSDNTYTIRFGIEMLMSHFLDKDFKEEYLSLAIVKSDEYYVNMMIAWYFATALAKQYSSTIGYIETNKLPVWVHNKTIQKAIESYRITDSQKEYLRSLKIKN